MYNTSKQTAMKYPRTCRAALSVLVICKVRISILGRSRLLRNRYQKHIILRCEHFTVNKKTPWPFCLLFFQGSWPAPDLGNWMCLNVADEFKVGSRLDSTRSEFKSKIWLFIFFGFFNWQIFKYSLPVRCEYTQSSQFLAISPTETFTLCQSQCHMPSLSWCTNLTAINVTKCRFQCHHCHANHTLSSYSWKQHVVNNIKHCQHITPSSTSHLPNSASSRVEETE